MSDWSPPTSRPPSPPIRKKGSPAQYGITKSNMRDDTRSLVISPQSVQCGSKQLLYFMFVQPTIKMTSNHDYKVIFQGDQKSTKVPAAKLNMYTLYARFPQRLLPGTTSCTVVHNNRRIGSVDLKIAGPTEVLTDLLESVGDPLELMCTAVDVKSSNLYSLDKKLHKICKNNMPPGGFEDALRIDQITTGMNTHSLFECPTALHFSAKYGLSNLCSVLLTWPGALQASRTVNKNGNWPSDMAASTGNVDLEEYIDEVVEQLFESSEYHQYESADAVDKKSFTHDIPGKEGRYVKFVQSTEIMRQHDYDNVTDGAMQDKDRNTQMENRLTLDTKAAQALPVQPPLKPKQPRLPGPMSMSYIDNKGGKLLIDDLAITLMFPPDSLPFGVITDVTLSVCWNEEYPPIAGDQMVLGPVIRCGPEGMTFQKHVQLSLPCTVKNLKTKSIQVWCNELSNGTDKAWKKVYDGNQPTGSSVNLSLVSNFLILSTPHFSRFSFLLRRRRVDRKILVFMTPIDILRTEYVYVKVYAVREDKEKETRLEETRYGGHTCAMPAEYEVKYGKKDLQITLTEFEPLLGWAPNETEKSIPYRCLQRGGVTSKCVFTMQKRESQINSIRGSLSIHQEGNAYSIPDLKFDLIFVPSSILESVKQPSCPKVPQRKESLTKQSLQIQQVVPDSRGSYTHHHVLKAKPTAAHLDNETHYYMAGKTKGLAIVVNIMTFPRRQRATKRSGSEIDLVNMVHLFREIGYEVEKYQDLTTLEITRNIKAFASRLNSREVNYHSAVIVLMSHGSTGTIHGKYDEMVLLKDIQAEFNGKKCPRMRGKPKLFFVQACRGTDQMLDTVLEYDGNEENDIEKGSFSRNTNTGQSTRGPDHGQSHSHPPESADNYQIEDVPENADMHLAYATTDGYLSLRSETEGSWFVQALSEVFLARVHLDSLDEIMNKVTSHVAALKGRMYDTTRRQHVIVMQSPERVSRMRKTLYFLPGYPP